MLQPRVDHLLDPIKLGSPEIAHLVEPTIDIVKARVHVAAQFPNGQMWRRQILAFVSLSRSY